MTCTAWRSTTPRVIERYERGETIVDALDELGQTREGSLAIQGPVEQAVLNLLRR